MPKYGGETEFQPREFPRSGSKAIDVERKKTEKKVDENMVSFAFVRHHKWSI